MSRMLPPFLLAACLCAGGAFAGAPGAGPVPPSAMQNCPSAVAGATTALKDIAGGIQLTVTGKGDAVAQIRARAKALVEASKSAAPATVHDSKGDGGGRTGRCPVVMFKSAVTSADVEGGVALTVKADSATDVDWLRTVTRERLDEHAEVSGGHGKMAHCPSALDGAATQVTDSKDGVVVAVTGKGDVVQAIRVRTTELLAAAAVVDTAVGHASGGQGGGGFGRCPIVVKDTVLAAKDIEGGSRITVTAKKPGTAAALQKEAHERAARLAPTATPPAK